MMKRAEELFPDATCLITGAITDDLQHYQYLVEGQITTFLLAILVIGFLMIIVFRSIKAGLIGLIPNITPVIVVGGVMGYFDMPIDSITMVIIPIILGIAVDDTIHFISHAKTDFIKKGDYEEALLSTFKTVGRSLLMTSIIISVTFLTYVVSKANVFINCDIIISSALFSALIADYTMTPILLKWTKPFKRIYYE